MPIIDIQRRVAEVGRIRTGASTPYTRNGRELKRPRKLETFRLTSQDRTRLEAAATLYGGTVAEWQERPGEYVLDTATTELPVVVLPGQALSQWYELWQGGECKRRCDGVTNELTQKPCSCPPGDERTELAKNGKACKMTTRLSVILREVPGVGYWRLESHGYYAAVELSGATEFLEQATSRGALLPARLRLETRSVVRNGQTQTFLVPKLDVDVTFGTMLAISRGDADVVTGELVQAPAGKAIPLELAAGPQPTDEGHTPAPARAEGTSAAEALAAVQRTEKTRHARSPEPIGPRATSTTKARPLTVPADAIDVEGEGGATPAADAPGAAADAEAAAPSPETPAPAARTRRSRAKAPEHDVPAADDADERRTAPTADDGDVEEVEGELVDDGDADFDPADPFPGEKYVTEAQAKLIHIRASKQRVDDARLDELIRQTTEQRTDSAKLVPAARLEYLLALIEQEGSIAS